MRSRASQRLGEPAATRTWATFETGCADTPDNRCVAGLAGGEHPAHANKAHAGCLQACAKAREARDRHKCATRGHLACAARWPYSSRTIDGLPALRRATRQRLTGEPLVSITVASLKFVVMQRPVGIARLNFPDFVACSRLSMQAPMPSTTLRAQRQVR
jgi:hypothetical protein